MALTNWNDILNKPKGIDEVPEIALTVEQLSASVLSISEDVGEIALDVSQLSASVLTIGEDVEKLKTFGSAEEVIGEWIDGKPLYRKVIEVSSVSSGNNNLPHGITNLGSLNSIVGTFAAFGNTYSLPNFAADSINALTYSVNSTNIVATVGANIAGSLTRLTFILTYTKTD